MFSSETKHLKIVDIVPIEYEDFLTYCRIAEKTFLDEVSSIDFVAYRSQFGRDKNEVKLLRSIIEAGIVLEPQTSVDDQPQEAEQEESEVYMVDEPENETSYDARVPCSDEESTFVIPSISKDRVEPFAAKSKDLDERRYEELLSLNASEYDTINLQNDLYEQFSIALSVRPINALKRIRCFTLKDLLLMSPSQLMAIKNLGAKSFAEIEAALDQISKQPFRAFEPEIPKQPSRPIRKTILRPLVSAMLLGEPYNLDDLTEAEKSYFEDTVDAVNVIGNELCLDLLKGEKNQEVRAITNMLTTFAKDYVYKCRVIESATNSVSKWNALILQTKLTSYIHLYRSAHEKPISELFVSFAGHDILTLKYDSLVSEALNRVDGNLNEFAAELSSFQNWMENLDVITICEKALSSESFNNERSLDVLLARASGRTLEEIAQQYNLTRERVRQIEAKALRRFMQRLPNGTYNIFGLISAVRNGDHVLRKDEIVNMLGAKIGQAMWYCATRTNDKGTTYMLDSRISRYDSNTDTIIVYCDGLENQEPILKTQIAVDEVIADLPDLLETQELRAILEERSASIGISLELLLLAAQKQYREAGMCSYKGRLTVVQMCDYILKRRFPNGYKIADETDGNAFIRYLAECFGNKGQMTTRAIDAKVMEFGVLIDRGKYIHKDYVEVDRALVDEVFAYIENSPKTAIAYFELYAALEDLLRGTPITNRYILQGIMKLYDCPYSSHRDYISKDNTGNVADELSAFVESAGTVHKSEIFAEFPGWKDYNLAFVLPRCPDIIGLDDGYFIHSSSLSISQTDRESIKKYLESTIHEIPVSARYLHEEFMIRFPEFMIANDIHKHGKLFGILQYLFSADYHFSRPYIAKEDIGEITNKSVLLQHLEGMDSIELDDFIDICKSNAVHYVSVSYLLDTMQPELVRIDERTLMRRECIGISESVFQDVADIIADSIMAHNGYIAASSIADFSWFPTLNVPWTPFLLESVVNMAPGGVITIKMVSSSSELPHSIFVSDEYADDDWGSLLVKLLKAEHAIEPFRTKTAILEWLQGEGLCNVKYPAFLDTENHVFFDEDGKLRVE